MTYNSNRPADLSLSGVKALLKRNKVPVKVFNYFYNRPTGILEHENGDMEVGYYENDIKRFIRLYKAGAFSIGEL